MNVVQNDSMLRNGKAMSRAPIMSGMQKLPKAPARMGMITKKIMMVACMVKAMLYCAGSRIPPGLGQQPAQPGHRRLRPGQLPAHDQGQQAADDHHEQAHEEELAGDHLVVGGEDVGLHEAELVVLGVHGGPVRGVGGAHRLPFPSLRATGVGPGLGSSLAAVAAGAPARKFSAAHFA